MTDQPLTLFDDWLHEYDLHGTSLGKVTLVRNNDEFSEFLDWLYSARRPLAYDIEATGLDIYSINWKIKTIQWGDTNEAWVFVWGEPWFQRSIDAVMDTDMMLLAHNATYDALGLDRHNHVDAITLLKRTCDTRILAHLADPRNALEGGVGHGLKNLSAVFVDSTAPDSGTALKKLFQRQGWTEQQGWANIPATHPTLVQYAGTDVILTAKLYPKLAVEVKRKTMENLVSYEHHLMCLTAELERRGILVDREYTIRLIDIMTHEEQEYTAAARSLGVPDPNSARSVAAGLTALGAILTETTPSGQLKVDKAILSTIASDSSLGQAAELAKAIMSAKNSGKLRESYLVAALQLADPNGRVHPKINSLQARTGRMSINNPPLQQLPSTGDRIRRMYVADEGHVMSSVDFSGVELRVLAALSQDTIMLDVFKNGGDLHQTTADNTGVSRKIAKTVNFGKVYGAGPKTISRQASIDIEDAQKICRLFDETYIGVSNYAEKLSSPIKNGIQDFVITYTGRKLPVDTDRAYSALNYAVQSTARDILGRAMIRLEEQGLWEYALLPIHDEVLFAFPEDSAEEMCKHAACTMEMVLKDVHISAEATMGGRSWGTLYTDGQNTDIAVTDDDRRRYCDPQLQKYLFGGN